MLKNYIAIALFSIFLSSCGGRSGSTPIGYGNAPILASISNQSTAEDTAKILTLVGTDAENNSLTYLATSSTSNITISISSATITLTPASNWNGTATITAKVNDGNTDSTAQTFTLTVSAVNDAPSLNSINNTNTNENVAKAITLGGTDVEGSSLTYSATSSTSNVVPSISGTTLTLTPSSNWVGTATISAKVNDGVAFSPIKTFTIKSWDLKSVPLVVVRMEWNNGTFNSNAATWAAKIFGTSEGQLNHYMSEISGGRFQFTAATENNGTSNDGIMTTTINKNNPNPIRNSSLVDQRAALTALDSNINFAAYDTDSNGFIELDELQIMFLHAGNESAWHVNSGVWAHQGWDSSATYDAVILMRYGHGNYSRFGEMHAGSGSAADATIGIIAHELGHAALELPDLYDYTPSGNADSEGIGNFGLMAGGSWTKKNDSEAAGATPVHPTGWSKINAGFIDPTVISSDGNYSANDATQSFHTVYKAETGTSNEYFLLENRDNVGYDRGLFSLVGTYDGGLLITHIDDNIANDVSGGVQQNENHKKVDVEEANDPGLDASAHRGDEDNLFYSGNSTTFNDSSNPNSKNYAGAATNVSITNISARQATMTFTVDIP